MPRGRKSFVVAVPFAVSTGSSSAVCHRLSLLLLLPGSAMAGLDGLIGAEERVINSEAKISNNVVRATSFFPNPARAARRRSNKTNQTNKPRGANWLAETPLAPVFIRVSRQRFNTAAPVQLSNQADLAANFVVIVTTVSRCAICLCVSGLGQPLSLTLNRLCILLCSHGMPLLFGCCCPPPP